MPAQTHPLDKITMSYFSEVMKKEKESGLQDTRHEDGTNFELLLR
jgi:hypothetical protein